MVSDLERARRLYEEAKLLSHFTLGEDGSAPHNVLQNLCSIFTTAEYGFRNLSGNQNRVGERGVYEDIIHFIQENVLSILTRADAWVIYGDDPYIEDIWKEADIIQAITRE